MLWLKAHSEKDVAHGMNRIHSKNDWKWIVIYKAKRLGTKFSLKDKTPKEHLPQRCISCKMPEQEMQIQIYRRNAM